MITQEQGRDLQHQVSLLNRLLEVSLILNSNLELKPLLDFIMEATCEITFAEAASILMYDPNKVEGQWTSEDHEYLSILAAQAAVAMQNARQAEQLKNAYDELSKLDKLKNDFIAIASHELRTPLGVILGYASFLKEEAQGEAS